MGARETATWVLLLVLGLLMAACAGMVPTRKTKLLHAVRSYNEAIRWQQYGPAASYIPAYGMIILTLTLLLRPTGLFGRRFASGAHGKF